MMKEVNFSFMLIIMMMVLIVDVARIPSAGNFDPFSDGNQSQIIDEQSSNESHPIVNLPSLDSIHDHVHHQSPENNETDSISNNTQLEQAGPSLDIIDSHPHDDEDNSSIIENAKRFLIQPSFDFLEARLHDGEEHIHDDKNRIKNTNETAAADLNDFQRWLKEQNETDQLNRFILLQKEINHFRFNDNDSRLLNDKLNRTIEELKIAAEQKQQTKNEL